MKEILVILEKDIEDNLTISVQRELANQIISSFDMFWPEDSKYHEINEDYRVIFINKHTSKKFETHHLNPDSREYHGVEYKEDRTIFGTKIKKLFDKIDKKY